MKQIAWIRPSVDALLMGGLSILLFPLLIQFSSPDAHEMATSISLWALWFVNWPHFSSTWHRLYGSKERMKQYPLTTWVAPLVMLVLLAAGLASELAAKGIVRSYFLWAPFHFSAQSYGICLVYLAREGVRLGTWNRRLLKAFLHGTFLTMVFRGEAHTVPMRFLGVTVPRLGTPAILGDISAILTFVFLVILVVQAARHWRRIPPLAVIPPVAQFLWFLPGTSYAAYDAFVPLYHSLQYLLIVGVLHCKETEFSWRQGFRWFRMNFIGGAFLFAGIPLAISLTGVELAYARAIVFALINLHHFYVDGVIWRLRDKPVESELVISSAGAVPQAVPA